MNIRPYQPADWPAVRRIYDLSKPDEMRGSGVNPAAILPLEQDPGMMALFDACEILVAEIDGQVAGFTGTQDDRIDWLFVHPARRRQGVGERLLRHILTRRPGPVRLHVASTNQAARRLYERLGFGVESEFTGQFNGQPCQVMRLWRNGEARRDATIEPVPEQENE